MERINMTRSKFYIFYIVLIGFIFSASMVLICFDAMAYTERKGTINGTYVNVRTSAGTSGNANRLRYAGEYVQLQVGNEVRIIDEANAVDGALWYQIKFNYQTAELTGYVHSAYVDVNENLYETDVDFEAYLNEQKFPESYRPALRELHAKYPKWVFVADRMDYTWDEVIEHECLLGRNLVWHSSISSWKSLVPGAYDWEKGKWNTFDGTSWVSASEELIAYCMDPRNFLDEKTIFMFELLSFNASIHKEENVASLLKNTFMEKNLIENDMTYAKAFMEAAAQSGVSPYHLASRVIQEVGSNGVSGGVTGNYRPATGAIYTDLYNYYNIGAYAHDGRGAVENGLIYASKTDEKHLRPWNTRYRAIVGGSIFIGSGYINIGQDTLYYEKFDLVGTPYTHQYMSNVLAPKQEALKMSNAYSEEMKAEIPLVFKIPVYQGMPPKASVCPMGDGSPNNILESIEVKGQALTPTFSKFTMEYDLIVPNNVKYVRISATAMDGKATIEGTGKLNLKTGKNIAKITVTADNGVERVYTITIVRKNKKEEPSIDGTEKPTTDRSEIEHETSEELTTIEPTIETTTESTPVEETTTELSTEQKNPSYTINYPQKDNYITGIEEQYPLEQFQKKFRLKYCSLRLFDSKGNVLTEGMVGTGTVVQIVDEADAILTQKQVLLYGDINGDAKIDIVDMLYMKRHILGVAPLDDIKCRAADINSKDAVDIVDMLYMKRHILGFSKISQ